MGPVNVVEAKKHFSDLMTRVAFHGERLIIERHGKPMMAWISMDDLQRLEALAEDKLLRRAKSLAALEMADQVRADIRRQRTGEPPLDSTEILYQLRESHFRESDDLC